MAGVHPLRRLLLEGFVPFSEKPHVRNPEYLATANQRIVDNPTHYLAEAYSDPYRGRRIYQLLDRRAASEVPMDAAFVKRMQRDALDLRAKALVRCSSRPSARPLTRATSASM